MPKNEKTQRSWRQGWAGLVLAVVVRPDLWITGLRQVFRFRRTDWWRQSPFLPIPDRALIKFRVTTAYGGDGTAVPTAHDVIAWLEWCRDTDHTR